MFLSLKELPWVEKTRLSSYCYIIIYVSGFVYHV